MNRFWIIFCMFCAISMLPTEAFAQGSQADKLYNEGVRLRSRGRYKQAIAKFRDSMRMNQSPENKRRCQQMIDNTPPKTGSSSDPRPTKSITVTPSTLSFPAEGGKEEFKVNASPKSLDYGISFFEESKPKHQSSNYAFEWSKEQNDITEMPTIDWIDFGKEDGILNVFCAPNKTTLYRETKLKFEYGNATIWTTIRQKGQKPSFVVKEMKLNGKPQFVSMNKNYVIEVGKKNGEPNFLISVESNSDTIYQDGHNWEVASMPSWVKRKSYKAQRDKVLEQVAKIRKKALPEQKEELDDNEISFEIDKMDKYDPAYSAGREGYIVLKSQEATCVIHIYQTKKSVF